MEQARSETDRMTGKTEEREGTKHTRSRERRGGRRPWTPGRAELAKEEHLQQRTRRLKVWWEVLVGGGSGRERTEGGRGEKARKDNARRFEQTKGDNRCGRSCGDRPMDIAWTI